MIVLPGDGELVNHMDAFAMPFQVLNRGGQCMDAGGQVVRCLGVVVQVVLDGAVHLRTFLAQETQEEHHAQDDRPPRAELHERVERCGIQHDYRALMKSRQPSLWVCLKKALSGTSESIRKLTISTT